MGFSSKLAELFVDVSADDRPLRRDLGGIRARLSDSVRDMARMARVPFAIGGALAGSAIAKGLWDAVQAAADLGETINKVNEVFGPASTKVKDFADDMADRFGLVKNSTLDLVSSLGLVIQAGGLAEDASADLSISLAKLAADAASFFNLPVEIVLEKMRSGLVGEAEPMRQLGVLLNEAAVQQEILASGMASTTAEITDQHKVVARANLIIAGLAKANGDLDRTYDSLTNRQKKLAGDTENLRTALGAELIPAMQKAIDLAYELGGAFDESLDGTKSKISALAGAVEGMVEAMRAIVTGKGGGLLGNIEESLLTMFGSAPGGMAWTGMDKMVAARIRDIQARRNRELNPDAPMIANTDPLPEKDKGKKLSEEQLAAAKEAEKFAKSLKDAADRLRERTRTEDEARWEEMTAIQDLFERGLIDSQTRGRGLAGAMGLPDQIAEREREVESLRARRDTSARSFGDVGSALMAMQMDTLNAQSNMRELQVAEQQLAQLKRIEDAVLAGQDLPEPGPQPVLVGRR